MMYVQSNFSRLVGQLLTLHQVNVSRSSLAWPLLSCQILEAGVLTNASEALHLILRFMRKTSLACRVPASASHWHAKWQL